MFNDESTPAYQHLEQLIGADHCPIVNIHRTEKLRNYLSVIKFVYVTRALGIVVLKPMRLL